ncbi:MAG: hypothetical protein NUW37_05825 [Planctomycetes bacterium]|nr:hypothetical protein [Planctomycetota bacterium]
MKLSSRSSLNSPRTSQTRTLNERERFRRYRKSWRHSPEIWKFARYLRHCRRAGGNLRAATRAK